MAIRPDYSFERDGIRIAEWLFRLVSDEFVVRNAAANALRSMWMGTPSHGTPLEQIEPIPDMHGQSERFKQVVIETLSGPSFATRDFVRDLCDRLIAHADEWTSYCDRRSAIQIEDDGQFDRIAKRINDVIASTTVQSDKDRLQRRLERVLDASFDRECRRDAAITRPAESMTEIGMMTNLIFSALATAILTAPDALRKLLAHPREARHAFGALERIGTPGITFAPELFDAIDKPETDNHSDDASLAARALGSIGADNIEVVESLIQRLSSPTRRIALIAATAFRQMGTKVAGQEERILPILSAMVDWNEHHTVTINALASVGRYDRRSRAKVIELAKPKSPEWATVPGWPDQTYDKTLPVRGAAIDSLLYFVDYPGECIPVLISTIEDFEEFDPDECYAGPLGRVAHVLMAFGRNAGAAALPLARKLRSSQDFPQAILNALEAMKDRAKEALPFLHEFRMNHFDGAAMPDLNAATDAEIDIVGRVIRAISNARSE